MKLEHIKQFMDELKDVTVPKFKLMEVDCDPKELYVRTIQLEEEAKIKEAREEAAKKKAEQADADAKEAAEAKEEAEQAKVNTEVSETNKAKEKTTRRKRQRKEMN